MKADELMLGDWVIYRRDFPDRVLGISADGLSVYLEHDNWLAIYVIKPIPLTEEVLDKNGFGYIERDTLMGYSHYYLGEPYFCRNMDLHIGTDNKGHFWLNYLRNEIDGLRYVHELQHAFRLLRIDREVVL